MNQPQSYMDMHGPPHLSSGPPYSHPAPAHYPSYPPPQSMQPAAGQYGPGPGYGYGYPGAVTSPSSTGHHMPPLSAMMSSTAPHAYSTQGAPPHSYQSQQPYDTTGQVAPPGMKPRVTATLWEDEGSLCFQVEAKGVCVARREDNHFINGTKLLNVAGMTRGRRDGILKSEKVRHVVKIGPMHLKGVWIPFDRALEFANKEKITDILYPLFVHNIGGLLYNPENASRTNAVVAASDQRRRMDSADAGGAVRSGQPTSLTHHHSMNAAVSGQVPSTPHNMTAANGSRPGIDRAHTFPTPPTSASSVMGMGSSGSTYEWSHPTMSNGPQPLSIDTGAMPNTRSMPTTPATTPPGQNVQSMQTYPGQGYEKGYYATTPSSQTGYAQPGGARFDGYKTDMGPPTAPNTITTESGHSEHKSDYGTAHPSSDSQEHSDSGYSYSAGRPQYAYNPAQDHQQLSPEMTSPPHQTGSGRGTPRTISNGPSHWAGEYRTPPQSNPGSMYNVIGDARSSVSSAPTDNYSASNFSSSHKRRRDEDDQDARPSSREYQSTYDQKRQKTSRPDSFGMPLPNPHMQAIKTGPIAGSR